eukprot:CAMPEP_0179019694 /NCGR_PEP_ID=MMETSP0796-20121207/4999_1 /TAXON_ID=73915 /ORGANISM="Pyrodinium bahamense, Strain pbaha01" /LENGTH=180 /DNA_ID=CAMNT_0020715487 /DNA_START=256 /DNA_END=794 /DNA_ORIENTATION=-
MASDFAFPCSVNRGPSHVDGFQSSGYGNSLVSGSSQIDGATFTHCGTSWTVTRFWPRTSLRSGPVRNVPQRNAAATASASASDAGWPTPMSPSAAMHAASGSTARQARPVGRPAAAQWARSLWHSDAQLGAEGLRKAPSRPRTRSCPVATPDSVIKQAANSKLSLSAGCHRNSVSDADMG